MRAPRFPFGMSLLLLGLAVLHGPALADCVDYDSFLHWVGGVGSPQSAGNMTISGHYAYVTGAGEGPLAAIDIADPENPVFISSIVMPTYYPHDVAVSGNHAFVADASSLVVVDVSDPAHMHIVNSVAMGAYGVTISGSFAYVVGGNARFYVVDISVPMTPHIVATMSLPGGAYDVAVSGAYAYVANGLDGFQIVDITNPVAPHLVGGIDLPGSCQGVAISAGCAYLAQQYDGRLYVLDISDPHNPSVLGSVNTGLPLGVAVSGNYAFVSDYDSGLVAVDVTDPQHPRMVGNAWPYSWGGVAVSSHYAFLTAMGLQVFDITNPESPPGLGNVDTPGNATSVDVSGSIAYVADGSAGFEVVDVGDLHDPVIIAGLQTDGPANDVAVDGTYAYVADGKFGLRIVDIADPRNPRSVGILPRMSSSPIEANAVAIAGAYAYLGDATGGFRVLDVSTPQAPRTVGGIHLDYVWDIAVRGSYAYVVTWGELVIVDVSNPRAPRQVGSIPVWQYSMAVALNGTLAYVVSWAGGPWFYAVDVSDVTHPRELGRCGLPYGGRGVAALGNYAYVGDDRSGVQVIDVSDPEHPHIEGSHDPGGGGWDPTAIGMFVSDQAVFAAGDETGLHILPIQCEGAARGAEAAGHAGAVQSGSGGGRDSGFRLQARLFPRSGVERACLSLQLLVPARVYASIHGVTGRSVRMLLDETLSAGAHDIAWDGRDDAGRAVSSGIYLVRASARGEVRTARFLMLR